MIEINFTIVIQVLQFLILVFLLNRVLFRPVSQVMAERQEKIASWEEKTRGLQETARLKLKRYEHQLQAGRAQALQRQEELTKELMKKEDEGLRAVSEEAASLVASTRESLKEETERLRQELRRQSREMSQMLTEKVLGRKVS